MAFTSNGYTSASSPASGNRPLGSRAAKGAMRVTKSGESGFLKTLRIKLTFGYRRPRNNATVRSAEKEEPRPAQDKQLLGDMGVQERGRGQEVHEVSQGGEAPIQQPILGRSHLHNPQDPPRTTNVTLAAGGEDKDSVDGYRAGDGAINMIVSPTELTIFRRLLKRTTSNNRHSWAGPNTADSYIPLVDEVDAVLSELSAAPNTRTQGPDLRPRTAGAGIARRQAGGAPADRQMQQPKSRDTAMLTPTGQQPLRKKASFRERLTVRLRPSPSQVFQQPPPQEDPRPRSSVYVPKHAASDFSRMTISSRSGTPRYSCDEARTLAERPGSAAPSAVAPSAVAPSAAPPTEDEDADFVVKPKRLSPPLQTLVETESTLADGSSKRKSERGAEERPHSRPQQERPRRNYHSYKLMADPWDPSDAGPSPPRPVKPIMKPRPEEEETSELLPSPPFAEGRDARNERDATSMTDYERFIARAEAEERVRREQIMRSLSQRLAAVPQNYVKPNPHYQYASATTGSNAVPPTTLNVGGGSRRSRSDSRRNSGQHHKKRSSWTPSFTKGEDEKYLGNMTSPPLAKQSVEVVRPKTSHDQQPHTLRRQTSIAQRIAHYVRPQREPIVRDEPVYRPISRSAMKQSLDRTPAVATVAEF